ncbi:DUF4082 domain-containing protein [Arthrobacter sp. PAMC25564]|uniref:DUF4082 domain-containing protein n=1 Tax=Arthrobacter sp. PAMC25564 TaxID=2565366 RepID=UPI001F106C74|nr:DUF4082 domain-containing protein [Arthrobacter sp. PAMC25564]
MSKVACENTQPGSPASEWQVTGAGSSTIQGYATSMSVNIGASIEFKVNTPSTSYHIDVYRLGYYQGMGARKVAANVLPSAALPQSQPACATFSDTGLIDCGNWGVSATWQVPDTAVSGVYLARLVRNDTSEASVVPFIVRDDAAHSAMLFQTSDATWQAYNTYGGNSLYSCTVACPAGEPLTYKAVFKVSYNRPFNSAADDQGRSWLMYAEYPMIRFMEANGYDVSYMSGVDVSTRGPLLLNHKVFMSVGHDEYWTGDQRANVEAARDAGVNLAFFSGNEMFWKTRLEPSSDGTNTPDRTLVAYKDTHFNAPTDPVSWTGTWRDPRFGTTGGGGNPENSLTGQFFMVNSGTTDIVVPAAYKQLRLWRGTSIANLAAGASATLGAGVGTLGYEWDIDADNGFRPAGSFRLSNTVSSSAEVFTDYGSSTMNGQAATHNLTLYKAPSGALVFGAGTVQWSWGLDGFTTGKAADKNMQQATVNLLADMGTQATTITAGLVTASASTDSTAPTSTIVSPTAGSTVSDGTIVTVTGTAADVGGVVAGVEVSTDGGATWRPATGTSNWTFSWNAHGSPTSTLRSRAVDDSGNIESPTAGRVTNVSCPCSMIGTNVSPAVPDVGDGSGIEVGAKFFSDVAGTISALRFYKSAKNTGTHVGSVWSESGQRLATVTFSGESATGWQSATLSPPLEVTANTNYVVSYFAPAGHYAQDTAYFYNHPSPAPAGNGSTGGTPLHFTRSVPGSPNGFYRYGESSSFPDQVYDAEYYWMDAVFSPSSSPAPAISSVSPSNNATGVDVAAKPSGTFNQGVTASSVVFTVKDMANTAVQGTVAYDLATNTATFTPGTSLAFSTSYTATVSGATNSADQSMAAPYSWTFTTAAPPAAPTVASVSPANGAVGVDTGVKPSMTFDQAVTGSSVVFTVKDAGGAVVAGTAAYDAAARTATFTPGAALSPGTTYTATVSGAANTTGQTMAAPYSWTFTTAAVVTCPCNIFSSNSVPTTVSTNDPNAVELGMKFRSDVAGTVTGVRFYKGGANSGTHVGHLWTATGTLLASVTFTGETDSGWQQAAFSTPVPISANTTYVVSYYAPNGSYSADGGYFNNAADTAPLHGLASGTDGSNGVYRYGTSTAFPTDSYNSTNYWVDVVLATTAPNTAPVVSSVSPADSASAVDVAAKPAATFDQAVTGSSVVFTVKDAGGAVVAGTAAYDAAARTATFTPGSALAFSTRYGVTVNGATNVTGQTMAPYSWTFTTAAAPSSCPCTVFNPTSVPATLVANDPNAVELGMKFRSDVAGTVTGVRFYKGGANSGTHVGHLWTATGTLLASVTFTGETDSGWQQAAFSTPVPISANTTYVVSYYAPNGSYSADGGYFNNAADTAPLHGLASGTDGSNGVYRYGTSTAFPTDSYNSTNYWVDVVLATTAPNTAPVVSSVSPADSASAVDVAAKPAATFDQAVTGSSVVFTVKDAGGAVVAGTAAYDAAARTATFTPGSALAFSTRYGVTVNGATNVTGQTMAPYSWTFTTAAAPSSCPCTVFNPTSVPATLVANDPNAVELGMKFRSDVAGTVTGVRFYKGGANSGTHVGHLWTATGTLLASVTFTGETDSGWQQAAFSTPVPISANTTYVVSYYAPNGSYSADGGYFNNAADTAPLHGLASGTDGSNGVYRYGTSTAFPTDSYNSTNYWVDVVVR